MKAQKTPKLFVGREFYEVVAYTDDETNKTSVDVRIWRVRSIRRPRGSVSKFGSKRLADPWLKTSDPVVNLVEIVEGLSVNKKGEYLKSISVYLRRSFRVTQERLPNGMYTTELAAAKYAVHDASEDVDRYLDFMGEKAGRPDDPVLQAELATLRKELKALKTRLTRLTKAQAKAKK